MISIIYTDNSIEISGHANYAKKGKDIVCAGVSAIFLGSLDWFKPQEAIIIKDKKTGSTKLELVKKTKANQYLIGLIVKQLKPIAKDFKQYVKLSKGK